MSADRCSHVVLTVACAVMVLPCILCGAERTALRPANEELRSPSFWVEQALRSAEQIEDRERRASQLWRVGVTAFDIGRFDLVLQIMNRPELSDQDHGTLGFRLRVAFEESQDLSRLVDLAIQMRSGFDKKSAIAAAAALAHRKGDQATVDMLLKQLPEKYDRDDVVSGLKDVPRQRNQPRKPPANPSGWLEAIEAAESGRFVEAVQAAKAEDNLTGRAYALASIATLMASAADRDPTVCRVRIADAEAAIEAAVAEARKDFREDDIGFKRTPEDIRDESTSTLVPAYTSLDDVKGTIAAVGRVSGEYRRLNALWSSLGHQARRGNIAFVRTLLEASKKLVHDDAAHDCRKFLAAAHVALGQFEDAENVAAGMTGRFGAEAMLDVAKGLAAANRDKEGLRVLERAERLAEGLDTWRPTPLANVVRFRARILDCKTAWDKAISTKDREAQVELMLAAAEGLLARLKLEPAQE